MMPYFFDVRKGDTLFPAEESLDLQDLQAAREEAARALLEIFRPDVERLPSGRAGIEVRDADGPVMEVTLVWNSVLHRRVA
jgi:hypothetical protein